MFQFSSSRKTAFRWSRKFSCMVMLSLMSQQSRTTINTVLTCSMAPQLVDELNEDSVFMRHSSTLTPATLKSPIMPSLSTCFCHSAVTPSKLHSSLNDLGIFKPSRISFQRGSLQQKSTLVTFELKKIQQLFQTKRLS